MPSPVRCLIFFLALAPAANAQRLRTDTLVIHFAFNHSNIRHVDSPAIRRLAADSILVIGHTDTVGTDTYNNRLSYARAVAAKTVLQQALAAVAAAQETDPRTAPKAATPIRLEAHGRSYPLPGDDSLSRRVELIVYYHDLDTPAIAAAPKIDSPKVHPDDEPDTTFGLKNINFIANTPILTDVAREALPTQLPYLHTLTADHYLEIDGFCNAPGPPLPPRDPLYILSIKRAKYIYDYLIEKGFDSTHLSYRGMGNASPVEAHPVTAADMDKNMRVEIRVFRKPPPKPAH